MQFKNHLFKKYIQVMQESGGNNDNFNDLLKEN